MRTKQEGPRPGLDRGRRHKRAGVHSLVGSRTSSAQCADRAAEIPSERHFCNLQNLVLTAFLYESDLPIPDFSQLRCAWTFRSNLFAVPPRRRSVVRMCCGPTEHILMCLTNRQSINEVPRYLISILELHLFAA